MLKARGRGRSHNPRAIGFSRPAQGSRNRFGVYRSFNRGFYCFEPVLFLAYGGFNRGFIAFSSEKKYIYMHIHIGRGFENCFWKVIGLLYDVCGS